MVSVYWWLIIESASKKNAPFKVVQWFDQTDPTFWGDDDFFRTLIPIKNWNLDL